MNAISISLILLLTSWFALAALIFILALIARFYEQFTQQPTYYRWYVAPVMLYGLASARYASQSQWGGDWIADTIIFCGGAILTGLCYHLYRCMTHNNR
jgi:hypothetical protein